MALQLKNTDGASEEKEKAPNNYETDDFSDLETTYKPVIIDTTVPAPEELSSIKNNSSNIISTIIKIVIAIVIIAVGYYLIQRIINPKATDITNLVAKSEAEIESELNTKFQDAPDKISSVHQYSSGAVSVHSDGKISIVYIDNIQRGIKIDDKKYSMFNVKIGDPEYKLTDTMNYNYTDYFVVLNDLMSGKSTTTYFYNNTKNDCLITIVNDNTGRVVSLTYYNDFALISENLSFDE
ncbi:MAG: hypothetical protein IJ763_03065 [Lachnospiraceae bacterium]|nr:hypothetical protein [Lachnospiraceae bacterium]